LRRLRTSMLRPHSPEMATDTGPQDHGLSRVGGRGAGCGTPFGTATGNRNGIDLLPVAEKLGVGPASGRGADFDRRGDRTTAGAGTAPGMPLPIVGCQTESATIDPRHNVRRLSVSRASNRRGVSLRHAAIVSEGERPGLARARSAVLARR